jgi:DNA-binding NarL/FixJ family response regulator
LLDGHSVVLRGEAGIGKTEVWRALLGELANAGVDVRRVVATATTRLIPGGALAGLVARIDPAIGQGDRLVATLRALGASGERFILGIDDAHLLDDESAAALLQHALAGGVALLTARSGEPAPDAVVRFWKDDLAQIVEVGPLSAASSALLVEELVNAPVDTLTQTRLLAASGGSPLLLRELIAHGRSSGSLEDVGGVWAWTGALAPGPNVAAVIRARLADLDPAARGVAERIAVAGPLPVALLERAEQSLAIEAARRTGVLRDRPHGAGGIVELAHPLYGPVLTEGLPSERCQQFLEQLVAIAEPLATGDGELEVLLAAWLVRLADRSHPELLIATAERAFSRADLAAAERLARAAVAAGGGARAERVAARVETFRGGGEGPAPGEREGKPIGFEAAIARAEAFFVGSGSRDDAVGVIERALSKVTGPRQLELAAFSLAVRLHGGDPLGPILEECGALLRMDPSPSAIARISLVLGPALTVAGRPLDAIGVLTRGLAAADTAKGFSPYLRSRLASSRSQSRLFAGALAEAAEESAARHSEAEIAGEGPALATWSLVRAQVLLWQGRTREAARRFGESIALTPGVDVIGDTTWCQADMALCLAWSEQAADARAPIPAVPAPGTQGALIAPFVQLAIAGRHLCLGAHSAAEQEADEALSRARSTGQTLTELIILHFLSRLRATRARVARIAELASDAQGDLAAALAESAAALLPVRGAALEVAARRLAQIGLTPLAAEWFQRAAIAHRKMGSPLASRRCGNCARQQRSAMEADPPLPASTGEPETLTPREHEVAVLAARSLTNRDIANRLGLSVRTVHAHLRTIYDKLGVNERSLLGALIEPSSTSRSDPADGDDR